MKNTIIALGIFAIIVWGFVAIFPRSEVSAGAFPGAFTFISTSSPITVSNNTAGGLIAFATSSGGCTSRVISISDGLGKGVNIKFSDHAGFTLSGVAGHFQAGSTTEVYDAEIYGCGKLTVFGLNGATVVGLTVTEFAGSR